MQLATSNGKRKCLIDLHDKSTLGLVAEAVSRYKGKDVEAKHCRNDAKTIISAYVLGQDVKLAAQRLLTWWCIDCGMETLYLDKTTEETVVRVMAPAMAGYAALEAIEKYGTKHANPKQENAEIIPFSTK